MAVNADIEYFLDTFYSRVRVTPPGYKNLLKIVESLKDLDYDSLVPNPSHTPEALIELNKQLLNNSSGFDALIRLREFKPVEYLQTYEDSIKDCEKIQEETGYFALGDPGVLNTKILGVTMYDADNDIEFNFGDFFLYMRKDKAYCVAEKDNTVNPDGFYHPYMSRGDNVICFGEHKPGYISAMKQGRFYDAFNIVKTVLSFYGGDALNGNEAGPHMALFNWAGQRCGICEEIFKPQEGGFSCSKSNEPICVECGEDDTNKDELTNFVYLPMFLAKCKDCEKQTINVRGDKCAACRSNSRVIS